MLWELKFEQEFHHDQLQTFWEAFRPESFPRKAIVLTSQFCLGTSQLEFRTYLETGLKALVLHRKTTDNEMKKRQIITLEDDSQCHFEGSSENAKYTATNVNQGIRNRC